MIRGGRSSNSEALPSFSTFVNAVEMARRATRGASFGSHNSFGECSDLSRSTMPENRLAGQVSSRSHPSATSTSSSSRMSSRSGTAEYWDVVMASPRTSGAQERSEMVSRHNARRSAGGDGLTVIRPNEAKVFECSLCPLAFRKKCNLETHINDVHEKIMPYVCSVCRRRFSRKSNCAKHVSLDSSFPHPHNVAAFVFNTV